MPEARVAGLQLQTHSLSSFRSNSEALDSPRTSRSRSFITELARHRRDIASDQPGVLVMSIAKEITRARWISAGHNHPKPDRAGEEQGVVQG